MDEITVNGNYPFVDNVKVYISLADNANMPKYMTYGSSGFDIAASETITIQPGTTAMIKTGITLEIPQGYELQIRPRSGLSLKSHLRVILGTIDSDYRGEIKVIADNIGKFPILITTGDRIAQGVIAPIAKAFFRPVELDWMSRTSRGDGGFGHTGVGGQLNE